LRLLHFLLTLKYAIIFYLLIGWYSLILLGDFETGAT